MSPKTEAEIHDGNRKRLAAATRARTEALRFLSSIEKSICELTSEDPVWSSKHMASSKRASMDLTRALADFRKAKM